MANLTQLHSFGKSVLRHLGVFAGRSSITIADKDVYCKAIRCIQDYRNEVDSLTHELALAQNACVDSDLDMIEECCSGKQAQWTMQELYNNRFK